MFKVKQNICPTVLSNLFLENKNVHDHYTRQADQFHVPVAKRNYMQKIIRYKGVCIWKSARRLWSLLPIIQNRYS